MSNLSNFKSSYNVEMRKILKKKEEKIKKTKRYIYVLIILLIISMFLTGLFCNIYDKEIKKLDEKIVEQEIIIENLNDKLKRKNNEINNKNIEFSQYKNEKENEVNELNKKVKLYEKQTGIIDNKVTSKINLNISDFKSWMPYTAITDRSSLQYELTRKAKADENGLLKIDNYYCVALGSAYGKVGDKFKITLNTNKSFDVIKADQKADIHTIGDNKTSLDGSQIEFIIDKSKLNQDVKKYGNVSVLNIFSGRILSIVKY
jgi:hypothetical protein